MNKRSRKLVAFAVTLCLLVSLAAPWSGVALAADVPAAASESVQPTVEPSAEPSQEAGPSADPSDVPSEQPSESSPDTPTEAPSGEPSETPSGEPSETPVADPAETPDSSAQPTEEAEQTEEPSQEPQETPTATPIPEDMEALLVQARTDGAGVAEILNAIEDEATFQSYTRAVLKLYYSEGLFDQLAAFASVIDARAAQLLADFAAAKAERDQAGQLDYIPGQVMVVYNTQNKGAQVQAAVDSLAPEEMIEEEVAVLPADDNIALVEIPLDQTVAQAIAQLKQDPNVLSAEPNYIVQLFEVTPEDMQDMSGVAAAGSEDISTQATCNDAYYNNASLWHIDKINTLQAWDYVDAVPHNRVRVAVLDSGVDTTHPDLQAALNKSLCVDVTNTYSAPYPTYTSDNAVQEYHGTHVSGIVAATSNNGIGVAGVGAGLDNSVVELMVVKVFGNYGASIDSVVRGINFAREKGAKVINMSLGGPGSFDTLTAAVNNAVNAGVTVVCAAGNGDYSTGYIGTEEVTSPSDIPSVISVINTRNYTNAKDTNYNNIKDYSSNYGTAKFISAPGTDIWSTLQNPQYKAYTGTSMAAPVVTGVVAMMLSVNPSLTPTQVKTILKTTATDLYTTGFDKYTGWGNVNAERAVKEALRYKGIGTSYARTVTFHSNGATKNAYPVSRMVLSPNTKIRALPDEPQKTGYAFVGWTKEQLPVDSKTAGTPFTTGSTVSGNMTVYAKWIKAVPATSVSVSPTSASMYYGAGRQLTAAMAPANTTDKLTWTSSNSSVVTVSSTGYITAVKDGTATITAKTSSGKTATCKVTVTYPDTIEGFVTRLYVLVLGRAPEAAGYKDWGGRLRSGSTTGSTVAYGFFFSTEYTKKNKSDSAFLEDLYKVMLNRNSEASGKAYWTDALNIGMSREYVFAGFVNSVEFGKICAKAGITQGVYKVTQPRDQNYNVTAFVNRLYQECLGRRADVDGINDWTSQLLSGSASGRRVAYSFFFSPEYKRKWTTDYQYVNDLYHVMLGRDSDIMGYTNWVDKLKQGKSREWIFEQFVYSVEFGQICDKYGIVRG